jgi:hypothetical protein
MWLRIDASVMEESSIGAAEGLAEGLLEVTAQPERNNEEMMTAAICLCTWRSYTARQLLPR